MNNFHTPVLLQETLEGLRVKKNGWYIDGTIGGGGHTEEILRMGAKVIGIDQDWNSILHIKKKFESEIRSKRLILVHGNFADIKEIVNTYGIEKVDGILLDLGLSSFQIATSGRGFTFQKDEPLDMRMDATVESKITAYDIVNKASEDELYEIFAKFGEEPKSKEIAARIVLGRQKNPIETTGELVNLILGTRRVDSRIPVRIPKGGHVQGRHPATRVFQALRIAVNLEIENLRKCLTDGFELLNEEARFAIISFHSLEDRTVKLFFLKKQNEGVGKIINKKPIIAGSYEIESNRGARSAKLRIIKKHEYIA